MVILRFSQRAVIWLQIIIEISFPATTQTLSLSLAQCPSKGDSFSLLKIHPRTKPNSSKEIQGFSNIRISITGMRSHVAAWIRFWLRKEQSAGCNRIWHLDMSSLTTFLLLIYNWLIWFRAEFSQAKNRGYITNSYSSFYGVNS